MSEESTKYFESVGKRKEAVARVRITPSTRASFEVNCKPSEQYFPGESLARTIREALVSAQTEQKFKITVKIRGGGTHAQAEAVRMGVARALTIYNSGFRSLIKKAGLLKRDARIKERRKFGLKKARKAPQWSKR